MSGTVTSIMTKKIIVYTCIIDGFDELKEPSPLEGFEYHAFVDQPATSNTWQVHRITRQFIDPRREARMYKLLAHQHFPDADYTFWLDGSIRITGDLSRLLDEMADQPWDLATFKHPERDCLYAEAQVCKHLNMDAPQVIDRQLAGYRAQGFPEHAGLYETSVLIRRHNDRVRMFNTLWWAELCTHSRRDQLSMPVAARKAGLNIATLQGNPQKMLHIHPGRSGHPCFAWSDHQRQQHYADTTPGTTQNTGSTSAGPRAHFTLSKTGQRIYLDLADRRGRTLMEKRGNFNPGSLAIWEYLLGHEAWTSILDIGANYGEMLLNAPLPDTAAIVAVEPNPHIHAYLSASLEDAGLPVTPLMQAVAAQPGPARMIIDDDWSGTSRLADPADSDALEEGKQHQIEVETTTLRQIIDTWDTAHQKRCLVKIDVEGGEIGVLSSLDDQFDQFASFFALVEILHLEEDGLRWLMERFDLYLLGLHDRQLHAVPPDDLAGLRKMLADGRHYAQDAVITPRKPASPSYRAVNFTGAYRFSGWN
jgi:FkbM family methyltransferase